MKRYVRCPLCGARALVEYGSVLREHERPMIAPGGRAPKFRPPLCRGPRPTPTAPAAPIAPVESKVKA